MCESTTSQPETSLNRAHSSSGAWHAMNIPKMYDRVSDPESSSPLIYACVFHVVNLKPMNIFKQTFCFVSSITRSTSSFYIYFDFFICQSFILFNLCVYVYATICACFFLWIIIIINSTCDCAFMSIISRWSIKHNTNWLIRQNRRYNMDGNKRRTVKTKRNQAKEIQ